MPVFFFGIGLKTSSRRSVIPAQVVSFKCLLKNKLGQIVSSSVNREVLTALQGPQAPLFALVQQMQDLTVGEKRSIELPAEQAFGLYDPNKVVLVPRKKIENSKSLHIGKTINVISKSGESREYRVVEIYGDYVSLDGNHPLAGQDLVFEIDTLDVRDATENDLQDSQNLISSQKLH